MQVMRIREIKRGLWEEDDDEEEEEGQEEEEESVLKERRAVVDDDIGGSVSSWSWVGIGVGFVEVNADKGSEVPMLRTMWFLLVNGVVAAACCSHPGEVIDHRKETWLGGKERSLSEIQGFGMMGLGCSCSCSCWHSLLEDDLCQRLQVREKADVVFVFIRNLYSAYLGDIRTDL